MSRTENVRLVEEFLRFHALSSTKSGVASFHWAIRRFLNWLDERPILSIKRADLTAYLEQLTADGLKSGTRNQYLCALRCFWRYHEDNGRTPFPASLFPKVPVRDKSSYPPIKKQHFMDIMEALPPYSPTNIRDRCAFSLLYATGLRINELLALKVTDLDLDARCATVKTEKRINHTRPIFWDDLTHKNLLLWLDARRHVLENADGGSPQLFINLSSNNLGIPLDDACLQRAFRMVRDRIKLPSNLVVHSFRHGFATRAHRKKVDVLHISKMLGHAKIGTTQIYLHTEDDEIEDVYRAAFGGGKKIANYATDRGTVERTDEEGTGGGGNKETARERKEAASLRGITSRRPDRRP